MTHSQEVKNQAAQRSSLDYQVDNDLEGGDYSDWESPGSNSDRFVDDTSSGASASELRSRIQQLKMQLKESLLSQSEIPAVEQEIELLASQVEAALANPKNSGSLLARLDQQFSNLEGKILNFDGDIPGGWGDEEGTEPIQADKIEELIASLEKGERKPDEESEISEEDCLKILKEALADFNNGRTAAASAAYAKVLDALGGPKDEKEIQGELYGAVPTEIEKDTLIFKGGKEGEKSFDFKSPGNGKTIRVEDAESVNITPPTKKTEVQVTSEGDYYVITVGKDIFKVNKDADIRIFSDKVTGDIGNSEGKVKIGADEKTARRFMSPETQKKFGETLKAAIGKTGERVMGIDYNNGINGNQHIGPREEDQPKITYGVQNVMSASNEPEDVKRVLNSMAEAALETDPKKQKGAWETALDALKRFKTDFDPGAANNRAQLLFNVLFGELGETGLKDAIKSGMIPKEFASELATILEIKPDENTKKGGEIDGYQIGGPGWTHGTSSEFLKKYSKKSEEADKA